MSAASRHPESHEAILRDVVTGDRPSDDPQVASLIRDCEECRVALAEVQGLLADLDRDARLEREALAHADLGPAIEVGSVLRGAPPIAHFRRRWLPSALLVAATLVFALTMLWHGTGGKSLDPLLNTKSRTGHVERLADGGLSVTFEPGTGISHWLVEIHDLAGGPSLIRSSELDEPHWTIEASAAERLPPRVMVLVQYLNSMGGQDYLEDFEAVIPPR